MSDRVGGRAVYTPLEIVAALKQLEDGKTWTADLKRGYRRIGTKAAGWSRAGMRGGGDRQLAAAASVLRGSATATAARVSVGGKRVPFALAAVWGRKGPTGWYAGYFRNPWEKGQRSKIDPDRRRGFANAAVMSPNNPRWIGQSWTVATKGEGPRGINDALADRTGDIQDEVAAVTVDVMGRAFPR